MPSFILPTFEKRFLLSLLLIAIIAYLFWTGSRYPALDEKAMMSGAIQLEDSLSFEAKFPLTAGMGVGEKIFWSTLNWINTNKKGMTFGVLFAAAFLTLLSYLRAKSFRGGFSNSLLGLAIGTPLGVCVNCAAPIARGMYSGGLRAETTLSAMIASPTLNVVVLTMLFSIMPLYMALTKIALSLIVILVAVPLIVRSLPQREIAPEICPLPGVAPRAPTSDTKRESLLAAFLAVLRAYAANLWYIVKMTVPLMLLAGLLGAAAATLMPGDLLMGVGFSLGVLVLVVLVGVFLPVPIAFDVVMAGALLSAGLEQGYVMALLFTLGSVSVYSFFIVAQSIALRAAWMLALAVGLAGGFAGWAVQIYHDRQSDRALELLLSETSQPWGAAAAATVDPWVSLDPNVQLSATPFAPKSPKTESVFERSEAMQSGIDKPVEFSFADMWPPFWEGRSLASADIDRDGDIDLAIASTEVGLYLYRNDGKGSFSRVSVDLGPLAEVPIFNAVLADFDDDGWLDLFLASYRQGNHVMRGQPNFVFSQPEPVASAPNNPEAVLSLALAVGDPDGDGDLDVALGNWAAGWYRRIPGEESRNALLWNESGTLSRATSLPGIPGETLSILFSDIDLDGAPDLLVGNDFEVPDDVLLGDGAGGFAPITHADGVLPHTTTTTMAIKSADLSGDGRPELYFAQIAGRSSGVSNKLKMQPLARYCDAIKDPTAQATCAENMEIKSWYKSGNNFDPTYAKKCQELTGRYFDECRAMLVKDLAIQRQDSEICALIPADQPRARSFCELHFLPPRAIQPDEAEAALPQILRSNVLLERSDGQPAYTDTAAERGLEVGGWSWDTKIADFDNDGAQDVYIVNGTWVPNEVSPSNLFFHNDGSGTFTEASGPFGLEDYLMTAAATVFDFDGDGDLDLLTHPVNGPLALFRNGTQTGHAITFEIEDNQGNRDGIGARLVLTDATGRQQSREIQLGGGFMSFDAPQVHFGLGAEAQATKLEIFWSGGGMSTINGPLPAGQRYRITRR